MFVARRKSQADGQPVHEIMDEGAQEIEIPGWSLAFPFWQAGLVFVFVIFICGWGFSRGFRVVHHLIWGFVCGLGVLVARLDPDHLSGGLFSLVLIFRVIVVMVFLDPVVMGDSTQGHGLIEHHKDQKWADEHPRDDEWLGFGVGVCLCHDVDHGVPDQSPAGKCEQHPHNGLEVVRRGGFPHHQEHYRCEEAQQRYPQGSQHSESPALRHGQELFGMLGFLGILTFRQKKEEWENR